MSTALKLRDYQRSAIDSVWDAHADGMRSPAVVLPTGAGKTVIFSSMIREWTSCEAMMTVGGPALSAGPRSMVLVHRDELADQAIRKIQAAAPDLSVGKVKAGDNQIHADVVVASVQTLARDRRRADLVSAQQSSGHIGLIITDECHHAAARSYQDIYASFPAALHAGFTATLERGDGVGLGSVWDDVVFSRSILWMIKNGHLVQPRAYNEDLSGLDLSSVKRSRGDYQVNDLGQAMEEAGLSGALPKVWAEHADGRPTIVFTPTVATAESVAQSFELGHGIRSAVVTGATPREERHKAFEDFRLGRVKVLVNCMVLTEGFDAPWASCAIIARPTQSRPLYVQMVGRVLRPWAGKTDAIVINVNGAGGRLSTLVDLEPGAVREVKEGEGLLDAEEREAEELIEDSTKPRGLPQRQIKLKEASSLFAASRSAWLSTAAGVMFISAGERTYFLWASQAEPGTWDVCWKPKYGKWQRTEHTGLDVELAMAWAEAEAEDNGSFSVARKASWRSGKASEAQLSFAATLGIQGQGMSKSDLSDRISVVLESRSLDQFVGRV